MGRLVNLPQKTYMSSTVKKILLGILIVVIAIQFFPIDKTNPPVRQEDDFIQLTDPPEQIAAILRNSCYDCHSNETVYPWYTSVAPISWWIREHIDHGREEMNFSTWGEYDAEKKDHKLEEAVEMVEESEMPLPSYLWVHRSADLDEQQRKELAEWFSSIR